MIGNRKDLIRCNNTSRSLLSQNWWFSTLAPVLKVDCSQRDFHMKQEHAQCVCVIGEWTQRNKNNVRRRLQWTIEALSSSNSFLVHPLSSSSCHFILGKIHLVFGRGEQASLQRENLFIHSFLVYEVFLVDLCDIDFSSTLNLLF